MLKLWKRLFHDGKAEFKRIGNIRMDVVETDGRTKKQTTYGVTIVLHMNGYGQRRYEYLCSKKNIAENFEKLATGEVSILVADLQNWKFGGALPKEFEPEGDVLLDMLNKLVQHKLTGDEFAAQD